MFTIVTASAMGLLWLIAAGFVSAGALCVLIVAFVASDILKTIRIKKQRRDGMH